MPTVLTQRGAVIPAIVPCQESGCGFWDLWYEQCSVVSLARALDGWSAHFAGLEEDEVFTPEEE